MLKSYGKLSSEVYDIDKNIGSSFGDVEYYYSRVKDLDGEILEPGVGTGRILIPLLKEGINISGFDSSNEMLKVCKSNCEINNVSTNLFIDKMESFKVNKKFTGIIVPTGTFLLLYKREDSIRALENFYNHLEDSGKLIIDITFNKEIKIGDRNIRIFETENGETILLNTEIIDIDYINQYSTSINNYTKYKDGKYLSSELEYFPMRWYGIEEFKMILEAIGFKNITMSSDYIYLKKPNKNSEIITIEAEK